MMKQLYNIKNILRETVHSGEQIINCRVVLLNFNIKRSPGGHFPCEEWTSCAPWVVKHQ